MIREIFFVARSLEDHEIFSSFKTWHPMSLQITPPFLFRNERDYDTFSTIENSESYSEMISSKIIDRIPLREVVYLITRTIFI